MPRYYVENPIYSGAEAEGAIARLIDLAQQHGFSLQYLEENGAAEHELSHAKTYFTCTTDRHPEVRFGVQTDAEGNPFSIFVETPRQDTETELRIACAPRRLSDGDRELVKRLLREIRRSR